MQMNLVPPQANDAPRPSHAFGLFILIALALVISAFALPVAPEKWTLLLLSPLTILLPTFALAWPHGLRGSLGWKPLPLSLLPTLTAVAASAALLMIPATDVASMFIDIPEETLKALQEMTVFSDWPGAVLILAALALLPGVCEELAFRGFIQGILVRHSGISGGILVTSVLFALVHFMPWFLPFYALLGIVFGLAARWSGSVAGSIVVHVIYNALVIGCNNIGVHSGWIVTGEPVLSLPAAAAGTAGGTVLLAWSLARLRAQSVDNR